MQIDFRYRHFKSEVIMMAMRWYLSYSLSYREVEELLLERGVKVDHSTVQRWVERYAGQLENIFRKKHKRYGSYVSWRMDETYIKLKGKWGYLYRAVDKDGDTIDFMFSETRAESDAFAFLKKAIGSHGLPEKVTIDKSGSNEAALILLNAYLMILGLWPHFWVEDRQIKYLNNQIEQDHRFIKKRVKPMMGFKSRKSLESTIAGYELIHMLRKGQFEDAGNMTVFEQFYALAA